MKALVQNFEHHGDSRWDSINIRSPECERTIVRREFSQTDSDEQRAFADTAEKQFTSVFADPRDKFDEVFAAGLERPATADELLAHLNRAGGAFWNFGAGFHQRASGRVPTEEQVRIFVADCPPFLCLLLGLVHAQFEWTIRARKGPGRVDLFSAIYLPYCDIYVTDDDAQRKCLTEIALTANLPVDVVSFRDFK